MYAQANIAHVAWRLPLSNSAIANDKLLPSSLLGIDRRFKGEYCLHHQGDEFIALMMEAVRTSEKAVYSNETTRRYIPEGSNLWTILTKYKREMGNVGEKTQH
jgi:hypothetical protein